MPDRNGYPHGTPSWVDIGTDVEGAKAFYAALFGWDAQEAGPPEQSGGYGFFLKGGKMVAGFGPQQNPGPPFWSTYVSVDDAELIAKNVEAAGGTIVVAPMDVMGQGHMAVFQDPTGAFISIWQPGEHRGAQLVNEPGAFCWNELNTRDTAAAKGFYESVFGWTGVTHEGEMAYTEFQIGGTSIAGMMNMPPPVPAEVPAHWLVYFAVEDVDAALAKVGELGGTALTGVMTIPSGSRFAVVADPQGAAFGIITLND
ncbi:MAG TPA: VOC family protein [Acidimicrobiales bacterium]